MEFSKSRARFRAWVLGASGTAGGYNAPGLPNITGSFHQIAYGTSDGAFGSSYLSPGGLQSGGTGGSYATTFQAARSSTVYGASATVMPPSLNIPVIFYLGRPK